MFFPANYSFTERKNLQEMHFKPEDQARQQTFASDKTKAGAAGMKPENNKVKRIEKEELG